MDTAVVEMQVQELASYMPSEAPPSRELSLEAGFSVADADQLLAANIIVTPKVDA